MSDGKSTIAPAACYNSIKPGYRVGDDGSVWSAIIGGRCPRIGTEWRRMKPTPQSRGHLAVRLGRADHRFVHVLVLEAFVGPCPPGMECRHLDGDPGNNRVGNLCWGTRKENQDDSVRHGTAFMMPGSHLGEENPTSKLTEGLVREIMGLRLDWGLGAKMIARRLGLPEGMRGAVDGIIRGQSWNHVTGLPPYRPVSHTPGRRRRAGEIVGAGTSDNVGATDSPRDIPGPGFPASSMDR